MKSHRLLVFGSITVLALLSVSVAKAQTTTVEHSEGNASAIKNLNVDGVIYDVVFQYGTLGQFWPGGTPFDFPSNETAGVASAAAAAALNTVPEVVTVGPEKEDRFRVPHTRAQGLVLTHDSVYNSANDGKWVSSAGPGYFENQSLTWAQFTPSGTELSSLYFAQFADGEGLFSQITLFSLSDANAAATISLKDDNGDPLTVDLNGNEVIGELEVEIPARGLRRFETDGAGDTVVGSVTVESDQALSGVVVFGGTIGLAGVGASPAIGDGGFSAPMEVNSTDGINTGIALMNLGNQSVTVTLTLSDDDNSPLATGEIVLAAMGHRALFVTEVEWDSEVDFSDFSGVLNATSDGTISATVIQTRPDQFATMPVALN